MINEEYYIYKEDWIEYKSIFDNKYRTEIFNGVLELKSDVVHV